MGCSGSTAATAATSDAIRRRVIVWECESDHGWSTYDAAVALRFELALTAGKRPITWQQGQFTYRLDWAKMVQVNTSSGTERAIRRTEELAAPRKLITRVARPRPRWRIAAGVPSAPRRPAPERPAWRAAP